jgi:hypothetical protein
MKQEDVGEWWRVGKDFEEDGRELLKAIAPVFDWSHCRTLQKIVG